MHLKRLATVGATLLALLAGTVPAAAGATSAREVTAHPGAPQKKTISTKKHAKKHAKKTSATRAHHRR
jgi:hypothetical protein